MENSTAILRRLPGPSMLPRTESPPFCTTRNSLLEPRWDARPGLSQARSQRMPSQATWKSGLRYRNIPEHDTTTATGRRLPDHLAGETLAEPAIQLYLVPLLIAA